MANTPTPTELYTSKTLFTLGGSSAAVWLFTTILALVFNVNTDHYKWIGLVVALAISFIGILRLRKINLQFGTIAFFNGLLIYVTAVGIDSINQGVLRNKQIANAALIPFTEGTPWWPTTTLVDSIHYLKVENIKMKEIQHHLELNNRALFDSLSHYTGVKMQQGRVHLDNDFNDAVTDCLKKNKALESEINRLNKELKDALARISTPSGSSTDVTSLLRNVRSLNKELLKNINEYLEAGDVKPKTQLEALRNTNENIYTLKIQLDEYNSKIDALISQVK